MCLALSFMHIEPVVIFHVYVSYVSNPVTVTILLLPTFLCVAWSLYGILQADCNALKHFKETLRHYDVTTPIAFILAIVFARCIRQL